MSLIWQYELALIKADMLLYPLTVDISWTVLIGVRLITLACYYSLLALSFLSVKLLDITLSAVSLFTILES